MKMTVQGAKAPITLNAEVLPVIPGVHMVEITRTAGDINDFYQLYALLSKAVIPTLAQAQASATAAESPLHADTASTSAAGPALNNRQPTAAPGGGGGEGLEVAQYSPPSTPASSAVSGPQLSGEGCESPVRDWVGDQIQEQSSGGQILPSDSSVTRRLQGARPKGEAFDGAVGSVEALVSHLQEHGGLIDRSGVS